MRRGRDNGFLYDADGTTLIGVNLGADYCSEHEWGIKGLQGDFAIPFGVEGKVGLAKRTITAVPAEPDFMLSKSPKRAVLFFQPVGYLGGETAETRQAEAIKHRITRSELTLYGDRTMATAWDEKSFGVHVTEKKDIAALVEIYDAFRRKDAAIWLGGGGVFQNAGLVLAIVSRIPKDKADGMREADEDRIKLVAAAKATGIEARLEKAGRRWFALSPGWKLESTTRGEVKTKHEVMFFLNPMEQHRYNSGWYTVEQLDEWAVDRGPIPKQATEARA